MAKPVTALGNAVGRATSVTWAPTIAKLISFGHLAKELGEPGTQVTVTWDILGTGEYFDAPATVATLPFLELRRS